MLFLLIVLLIFIWCKYETVPNELDKEYMFFYSERRIVFLKQNEKLFNWNRKWQLYVSMEIYCKSVDSPNAL